MRNSRSNLGFVRILACRLDIICLRHCGTRLVVVVWVRVAPPCFQRLGVLTPVILTLDRNAAIARVPMPIRRVEFNSLLGWSFSITCCAP